MTSNEAMIRLARDVEDAVNALNHAAYRTIEAPLVYDLTGTLKVAAWGLAQLCEQMADGLDASLDEFEVYDRNRDPEESAGMARVELTAAAVAARRYADALGRAQVAINLQGHDGPKAKPEPDPGTPGAEHEPPSRDQIAVPLEVPADAGDEARAVFPDPAAVDPLVPMYGVVRCGVCGEPLQKAADRDAYECPQCVPLYDRDKHKGEDYRRGGSR